MPVAVVASEYAEVAASSSNRVASKISANAAEATSFPANQKGTENAAISKPPPEARAEAVQKATNAFHATANPPVAALFDVKPAGGIARTILVDPKRSTTTRVPLGLRMRREGRDDIEYPGGTPNSPKASANAPGATTGAAFRSSPGGERSDSSAPRSVLSASRALANLSSGVGSKRRVTTASSRASSMVTTPRKSTRSRAEGIVEGARPLSRNSSVAPAEYRSETAAAPPIICSGAAYPKVPTTVLPWVHPPTPCSAAAAVTAASAVAPKSTRLTVPVARSSNTLPGFTSRCSTGGRSDAR